MNTGWRKSTRSGAINDEACVEVAELTVGIGIRDSKDPDGGHLAVGGGAFGRLLRQIKDDQLNPR